MLKRSQDVFVLIGLLVLAACGPLPPASPVPPGPPPVAGVGFTLEPRVAGVVVHVDDISCVTNEEGVAFCVPVPAGDRFVQLELPHIFEPDAGGRYAIAQGSEHCATWPNCEIRIVITPKVPPLSRVSVSGTRFMRDGQPFNWHGVSAFQLVQLMATGRTGEAEAFVRWATGEGVTVFRIFTTVKYMFGLTPEQGRAALPATLTLLHRYQAHAEVVAIADSCGPNPGNNPCPDELPYFDTGAHVRAIGEICAADEACLSVQIANEPDNRTQARIVQQLTYLCVLAQTVPRPVLVTLGPGNEADDGVNKYSSQGCSRVDYNTAHGDRADGDDGWRWVRHTREMQTVRDATNQPMVNDEPNRVDHIGQNFGVALICKLYGLGDTVHLASLRFAQIPTGAELAAFKARTRAWALFPRGFSGRYSRATLTGDPVLEANLPGETNPNPLIIRLYSGLDGGQGFVAGVGVKPGGEQSIVWGNGWSHERVASEDGAVLYRVTR